MHAEPPQSAVALDPAEADFLAEVIAGLSATPRTLPCKFFYDEAGSELFRKICELPEYYVTRTELKILQQNGDAIAAELGPRIELIGLGTGAGTKTRLLLEKLDAPVAYVPVDISGEQLEQSTNLFRRIFPQLEILPVCTDYLQPFLLPTPQEISARKIVYFPGSTIGNFQPDEARNFLRRIHRVCEKGGGLLIGVDLQKDRAVLESAYNDSQGITARFNLNLLVRANRILGADFRMECWSHRAIYNAEAARIEMNLISEQDQTVHIGEHELRFHTGEKIITEYSYKHTPEGFSNLAAQVGFHLERMWTDDAQLFGVFYFAARS